MQKRTLIQVDPKFYQQLETARRECSVKYKKDLSQTYFTKLIAESNKFRFPIVKIGGKNAIKKR